MKFCPNCGSELTIENIKFCYECGYKIPTEEQKTKVDVPKFKIENEKLISYNGDDINIILPDGIKTLKNYSFCNVHANNKTIILSDSVEKIEAKAFYAIPNVERIFISKSVKEIDPKAFFIGFDNPTESFIGCISLKEIDVDKDNPYFTSIDGNLYSKDGKTLIKYAPGKKAEVFAMPEGTVITKDYASLIDAGHLKKVILPSTFGDNEFVMFIPSGENYKVEIEINENNPRYKMIGQNVFSKDEKVFVQYNPNQDEISFIIPKSVERIDNCAFEDTNLESIIVPSSVKEIGELAFGFNYELSSITLPNSIKSIGVSCFMQCSSLENITLPNGLEKIEASTFECAGVKNLIIPSSVKEIEEYAFADSYIESIFIPSSVKRIGEECFNGCYDLKEVVLNEGLEEIENGAFYDCANLKEIKIPSSVKTLGEECFGGCLNLKKVYVAKGKTYQGLPSYVKVIEY